MDIGKSIKIALIKKGENQKWLGEQLGHNTPQNTSHLVNSKTTKQATIERLAEIFEMPVSEFIALGE